MPPPPKARDAYHHGDLRNALVRAAIELLEEGDAAALSLREVARRAGVSQAAPYHHFDDKSALLAAVATEGFATLESALGEALRAARRRSPASRVGALLEAYVRFALAHGTHYRAMFVPELKDAERFPALKASAERSLGVLAAAVAEARQADVDEAFPVAVSIWAWGHGLASLAIDGLLDGKGGLPFDALLGLVAREAARLAVR